MKKENILMMVIALLVGLLGGLLIFSIINRQEKVSLGNIPAGVGSPLDYRQRIAEAEKIVAADPNNLQAWIQLGNDYYDTDQPQKAIFAYGKALELQPENPNVLTDQGVMYRRLGEVALQKKDQATALANFQKAIANFEQAQKIDPKHLQSLYNLGIVYYADLQRPDKALEVWNRYLQIDSMSPQAQQVKGMVEEVKAGMQQRLR